MTTTTNSGPGIAPGPDTSLAVPVVPGARFRLTIPLDAPAWELLRAGLAGKRVHVRLDAGRAIVSIGTVLRLPVHPSSLGMFRAECASTGRRCWHLPLAVWFHDPDS